MNEIAFAVFAKSFGVWDAFVLFVFFLVFVAMIYGVYAAIKRFQKTQEKAALIAEKILPQMITKFGDVILIEVSHLKRLIKFERNETVFELKVTPLPDSNGQVREMLNEIRFNLPNLREKFYIQHKSFFFSKSPSDCREVQLAMPNDFIFHSLNPQFLVNLMAKENVQGEIYKYQKNISRKFSIAFENGLFTATWHRGQLDNSEVSWDSVMYGESAENEAQKLEQFCRTAVVFYDELAKK